MNFIELINIDPLLSSFLGICLLINNYFFCYLLSLKYNFFYNKNINFIFFNILFYSIISSVILFFLLLNYKIILIRYFFYFITFIQILYILINYKLFFKFNFDFFHKFDFIIIILFFFLIFSPISDADSLDYHLGGVLEIIRSDQINAREDHWFHFRLLALGEMINLYGLFYYSLNFGQIFQLLALTNLLLIFNLLNSTKTINYLIVLSFPIFISLSLSAKQILIATNCYLIIYYLIMSNSKLSLKSILAVCILIIFPIGLKYNYLIYSFALWCLFYYHFSKQIYFKKYFLVSVLIFIFIPGSYYLKNFIHYGDPLTPFLEFLKSDPNKDLIFFSNELRLSQKIFNYYEFLFIPFYHILPIKLTEVSLLVSPIVLLFYYIIFKNNQKHFIVYLLTIFIILFILEKSPSRYYLDLYMFGVLVFLKDINLYKKNKLFYRTILLSIIPYFIFTILITFYSIFNLTLSSFDKNNFTKTMNLKANNYEIVQWVNNNTEVSDILLFDYSIRSKSYQKNKFYFYDLSLLNFDQIKSILYKKNITKLIISELNFKTHFQEFYKCEELKSKTQFLATRNPFNSLKNNGNIYILDINCFSFYE